MWTVVLLIISNVFMTFAWYGHLRHKSAPLLIVIVVSWLIAFLEYCFQVPANRMGSNSGFTAAELKTIQEVITLVVFCVFATWYLREQIEWTTVLGFILIAAGATCVFKPWAPRPTLPTAAPTAQVVGLHDVVPSSDATTASAATTNASHSPSDASNQCTPR
ncbi:MAG: hypothetical protein GC159_12215 [Phycisphaera sp.]|nr:hypothetical protein [Phycisphaera sp.]